MTAGMMTSFPQLLLRRIMNHWVAFNVRRAFQGSAFWKSAKGLPEGLPECLPDGISALDGDSADVLLRADFSSPGGFPGVTISSMLMVLLLGMIFRSLQRLRYLGIWSLVFEI